MTNDVLGPMPEKVEVTREQWDYIVQNAGLAAAAMVTNNGEPITFNNSVLLVSTAFAIPVMELFSSDPEVKKRMGAQLYKFRQTVADALEKEKGPLQ